jgi:hypothetical protein
MAVYEGQWWRFVGGNAAMVRQVARQQSKKGILKGMPLMEPTQWI